MTILIYKGGFILNNEEKLSRSLKSRHIQMIAIGGSVGVGLFLASSKMIEIAGPSVLLSFSITGFMVYLIMRSLGEMSVQYPVSGSFSAYANEFWSPLVGYITGWSYWFLWGFGAMAETTAIGIFMKYWFPDVPIWIWALASLVMLTLINLVDVKFFGEFEFWFSIIKVVTIIAFIILGFALIIIHFANSGFREIEFANLWTHGGFFPKGILSVILAIGPVSITFIGLESVGLTAGETKNPEKELPSAINKVLLMACIFYIGSMLIIMSLFPWDNIDQNNSPFVLTFENIGLRSAAGIINFVMITSTLSACNSGVFSSSRMVHTLASQDCAPRFLGKLNKKSVPVAATLFSSAFMLIGVVISFFFPEGAFDLIFGMCGMAGVFIWMVILITQIKFRKTLDSEAVSKLKYRSLWFPRANYACLGFLAVVVITCLFDPARRLSVLAFPVWLLILVAAYYIQKRIKEKIHG